MIFWARNAAYGHTNHGPVRHHCRYGIYLTIRREPQIKQVDVNSFLFCMMLHNHAGNILPFYYCAITSSFLSSFFLIFYIKMRIVPANNFT